jgi:hypothetical protein
MSEMLGKALFRGDDIDFAHFRNYFSEPTLKSLYKDAGTLYSEISSIEKEFSYGFKRLKKRFPSMQIPAIYMHVSGFGQNMIVANGLLSCSIDKYLGADYPLYKDYFADYRRREMVPERIVKDGLSAWIQSEYPFRGRNNVLLDRMIYEGKIIYILTQTGKNYSYRNILSLTEKEYKWLRNHESAIWKVIIERKHLYTPDAATTSRYFQPLPSVFISDEAPGNLGHYIGYRIVSGYMKRTKSTCEDLMNNNDAQDILNKSKYKP